MRAARLTAAYVFALLLVPGAAGGGWDELSSATNDAAGAGQIGPPSAAYTTTPTVRTGTQQAGTTQQAVERHRDNQSRRAGRRNRRRATEAAEGLDPEAWFGDWWTNTKTIRAIREALRNDQPVHIKRFLRDDKAAQLHSELFNANQYQRFEMAQELEGHLYQFHYSTIRQPEFEEGNHSVSARLFDVLDSKAVKEWVGKVGGCSVTSLPAVASMTHYLPGDYVMAHTDATTSSRGGPRRRIAFVLHSKRTHTTRNLPLLVISGFFFFCQIEQKPAVDCDVLYNF